ncbi:MAG: DUF4041 domain-containing protein [Bacteroidetes bacterium]|nr:DUF4041 domain-containing protein [Bacteroidota bacterium]
MMDDQTHTLFGLGIGIVLTSIVAFIIISSLRKKITSLNLEKDSAYLEVDKLKEHIIQFGPLAKMSESINSFEEKVKDLKLQLEGQKSTFDATSEDISKMRKEIELFQDTLELGTYGVYQPQFNFEVSSQYSEKLELNYQKQRLLIKQGAGAKCDRQWVVGGSQSEGKKMTKQYEKLMIFAFNGECEAIISKVKWNNIEKSKERIVKIYENVNTLGSSHEIYVTKSFLECKLEELALTYEYELQKNMKRKRSKNVLKNR